MSDLYRADASNFTREQLVELINIQTNLQLEANKTIVIAKGKIEELEHKLELAVKALEYYTQIDFQPNNNIAIETLERLK